VPPGIVCKSGRRDERLIMPGWIRDIGATPAGLPERAALAAERPTPVNVKAMATASRIFAAAAGADALAALAASALAEEPGQMCLVSMACREGDGLRPVAVAHARPTESRKLQRFLAANRPTPPADAFSRAVLRSGGALHMAISSPRVLRLWLPEAYWPSAERAEVSSVLAAALRDRERVFGTLLLWRERDEPAFNELDQAYVVSLATRLALGLATLPMAAWMTPAVPG
jgi:hypothetical protein